ncbi:PREDICTED: uncharacterized protein LOC107073646 [Polistes dominula]|uniref:Uncharacterized protein LOC107073646 n=1 Tax=Polistes dominula TaxID=743375 RepID=A0ABM1JBI7_POLDO|nr:PREDICTED: uncharacterized protein LOC107073646 [Polistes dominula]
MSSSVHLSHLTLLATATAIVVSATTSVQVRLLIDPGSEILFVSERLTQQLNLERRHSRQDVYSVGRKRTSQTRGIVTLKLQSRYRPLTVTISAYVLKTVTTILPAIKIQQEPVWPHLKGLNLADPEFFIPRAVEVIVGADFYGQLIRPNIIRHSNRSPIAQLSVFGWLVIGPIQAPVTLARTTHHGRSQASNSSLQELLTRFWVQKEPPSSDKSPLTPEEQKCELHFKTTHSRDSTGRCIVKIPLKLPPTVLGDSYQTVHRSLQRILKRLGRDTQYDRLYTQFMPEYEQAQHMIKLDDSLVGRRSHYYLPHHVVLKPDS